MRPAAVHVTYYYLGRSTLLITRLNEQLCAIVLKCVDFVAIHISSSIGNVPFQRVFHLFSYSYFVCEWLGKGVPLGAWRVLFLWCDVMDSGDCILTVSRLC